MAYSSLGDDAQAIKLCDLCQEDNIKWRCIDCDMCLCGKCKTFHLRVPVTAQHQIITITPLEDVQRKIIINNIPCNNHETKVMCLFCRTCDCLVCTECFSIDHQKHHLVSIEKALGEKLDKVKEIQTITSDNIKLWESRTEENKYLKPKYNASLEDSETKIKQREQELKDTISKYSKFLLDKVEGQRSKGNMIDQALNESKQELENQSHKIETILKTNQGIVIFATDLISNINLEPLPVMMEQFSPGKDTPEQIQNLFGSLKRMSIQPDFEIEVLKSFTLDLPAVTDLMVVDESSIWISCFKKHVVRKSSIHDSMMTTSTELSFQPVNMALTSDNDILFTDFNSSEVKILTKSGELRTFLSVAPLLPKGIHVTEDKNVIVGVREIGDPYILTNKSQRAIIVFGMDGKQKHWFENNKHNERMFTVPLRIRTNYYQDILVVDCLSNFRGRLVTLDMNGDLKWVYKGNPQMNAKTQFDPRSLVSTTIGHIVVNDYKSNALHILSKDGEILACKDIREIGMIKPTTLNIDRLGRLFIGCLSENKTDECKIYIVKKLW